MQALLAKLSVTEIVHLRGHVLDNVTYRFERNEEVSTEMWNPLLFAVHVGALPLVRLLVERATHTPLLCLMKPCAENETDDKNVRSFPEDKIYALLIAYENQYANLFAYLLDTFAMQWSKRAVPYLTDLYRAADERGPEADAPPKKWLEGIPILLRSATAIAYYKGLPFAEKRDFVFETMHDLADDAQTREAFANEFAEAPYAGVFLFFLLFDDKSDNEELVRRSFKNAR